MKDWPSGSYLVAECEEIGLFIVGYKYNYKKKCKFWEQSIYLERRHCPVSSGRRFLCGRFPSPPEGPLLHCLKECLVTGGDATALGFVRIQHSPPNRMERE